MVVSARIFSFTASNLSVLISVNRYPTLYLGDVDCISKNYYKSTQLQLAMKEGPTTNLVPSLFVLGQDLCLTLCH